VDYNQYFNNQEGIIEPTLSIPLTPASSRASRQAASVTVSSSSHPPLQEKK